MLTVAPAHIFDIMWNLHFVGKIGKLSSHPIANFVVSTGVRRASEDQMRRIIEELKAVDPSTLIREYLTCLQVARLQPDRPFHRFCQNVRSPSISGSFRHDRPSAG